MSKVTSKRQVTIPKEVADLYGIEPGDEIAWIPDGRAIRVVPGGASAHGQRGVEERLASFDRATARRDESTTSNRADAREGARRGWTREELHERGRAR